MSATHQLQHVVYDLRTIFIDERVIFEHWKIFVQWDARLPYIDFLFLTFLHEIAHILLDHHERVSSKDILDIEADHMVCYLARRFGYNAKKYVEFYTG